MTFTDQYNAGQERSPFCMNKGRGVLYNVDCIRRLLINQDQVFSFPRLYTQVVACVTVLIYPLPGTLSSLNVYHMV